MASVIVRSRMGGKPMSLAHGQCNRAITHVGGKPMSPAGMASVIVRSRMVMGGSR